ncbi:sugar ABC transporter ATP-binding protein [Tropicimonas isoalkanivorans]|uniref:Monosaccharide ABC transporter ATP-binding protein, CUT2 family (TC 3.A.1.2.-) n=1 Tax=Tropicimonas isoalkanivorans TaxID=441112 RepID=A0A1I1DSD9_9RHOB|nr:sugar ABC transporter ATP-binding protein [Tropicimonas isoalkanivorans]SFB77895.1 monosaccharide ABC transporter ATP-binding protein, CUT2 family (TC 3.A.1.2.-) [Tropicimonas isoalkanivorans]
MASVRAPAPTSPAEPPGGAATDTTDGVLVEARGITQTYPGVTALEDVAISIRAGSVHVIAGENGAGKSTLVKILTGTESPTRGEVIIGGRPAAEDPQLFHRIGYVPQELSLFSHMTVAENLFMPFEQSGYGGALLNTRRMQRNAAEQLERFKINARPEQQVQSLSVSDQQLLMIARALSHRELDVLILDEPTSSLTASEVERLFDLINALRDEGKGIVFISHKSEEVFEMGDETTVLRNGKLVGTYPMADLDERRLLSLMAGREVDTDERFKPEVDEGEVILQVRGLTGPGFENISFELRRGEVLGLAGLVGAGRTESMQAVFGYLPVKSGDVVLDGEPLKLGDTSASVRAGLLYLSEERKLHGILPLQSVLHNIGVTLFDETARRGLISASKERARVSEIVQRFDVKTSSLGNRIMFLSGGNQQKAIIGRAMALQPKVLILDEPTRGIDVRTKIEVYRIITQLAEAGVGVIVISSEMTELRKCSTRIACLYAGRIQAEFDNETCSNEELVTAIFGGRRDEQ